VGRYRSDQTGSYVLGPDEDSTRRSDERASVRRELQDAGRETEYIEGDEPVWRNPQDGNWYEERRAIEILKGGEDVGASD
jgi:hypothetical protein